MNTPPCVHLRVVSGSAFQQAYCGVAFVDPHGERVTTDRARVTCRQCRRLAHLDRPQRPEGLSWEGWGE